MDRITKAKRSWNMAQIKNKNTLPEKRVRSFLHKRGFRFRLHSRNLPGTPDVVLSKYRTVIFVHGCFWHHHKGCRFAYVPKNRRKFWLEKFHDNIEKCKKVKEELKKLKWTVIVLWECKLTEVDLLKAIKVLRSKVV